MRRAMATIDHTIDQQGPCLSIDKMIQPRLWQLMSPLLPVGAYQHSQGLEQAVARGWIPDAAATGEWIEGLLRHVVAHVDIPVAIRARNAWASGDAAAVAHWDRICRACRETAEARREEADMGSALMRLLRGLDEPTPEQRLGFVAAFGVAGANAGLPAREVAAGLAWAWCESQTLAAVKLARLGHIAGQRILRQLGCALEEAVATGMAVADDDIGRGAPYLALAGAWHETQPARLYRS